jgi:hypothetical protein
MFNLTNLRKYPYLIPNKEHPRISLQENVTDYNIKFIFTWRKKSFYAVESYIDFYHIFINTPPENRNFYEIIQQGPQKLHFDIDMKKSKVDHSKFTLDFADSIKDNFIKGIVKYFSTNVEIPLIIANDIVLFTSHGQEQFSYHIIVDNFAVQSSLHCKDITLKILNDLPEDMRKFIDVSVNSSNQQFRMWKNCKEKESTQRFKELCQDWIYFSQPIHWEPRINNDPRWLLPDLSNNPLLGLLYFERTLVSKFVTQPFFINHQLPTTSMQKTVFFENIGEINTSQLSRLIPRGWTLGKQNENFFSLIKDHPTECPLHKRIHENENQHIVVIGGKQDVFFKCYRSSEAVNESIHLGTLNPTHEFTLDEIQARSLYKASKPPIKSDNPLNSPVVGEITPAVNTILLIRSYLGTGKTSSFINYIRENNSARVLILSPRQLYARSITGEYNCKKDHLHENIGELFNCYLDVNNVNECNRLVLQMESLHKLDLNNIQKFDVLILDEIEALLKQFSSKRTMKNLIKCSTVFERLVRETPIVIGGDAFLGMKSISTLKAINPQVQVIRNDYLPIPRKAYEHLNWDALVYVALEKLLMGKKLVFVVASKEKAREFAAACVKIGIGYKLYTGMSENVEQDQIDLSNVNESWNSPDIRCVIYTSTITVGVNFDLHDIFDELFVYGSSYGCTARDIFQGMMRVRHLKDNTMHYTIYTTPVNGEYPTTREDVKSLMLIKCAHTLELTNIKNAAFLAKHRAYDPNQTLSNDSKLDYLIYNTWESSPDWLIKCHIENIREDNFNKVKYGVSFNKYLKICNYTRYKNPPTGSLKLDSCSSNHTYENVPDITRDRFKSLQTKIQAGIANLIDHLMHDKYMLKKMTDENTSIDARRHLFEKYLAAPENPEQQKNIFFNVYREKYSDVVEFMDREMLTRYIEFASNWPMKLQLIKFMNSSLGISNSCQGRRFTEEELVTKIHPLISPVFFELELYFGATSTADRPSLNVSNRIEKIYKLWCGATCEKSSNRITVNGKRERHYTVEMSNNSLLWDSLCPWKEDPPEIEYKPSPLYDNMPFNLIHQTITNPDEFIREIVQEPVLSTI